MARRPHRRARRFAGAAFPSAVVVFALAASPTPAAEPDAGAAGERLKEVERAIEEGRKKKDRLERRAAGLDDDARRLSERLVVAARTLQENEREVAGLETDVARLEVEERAAEAALDDDRRRTVGVLMALQRLARHPPEAIIVQPIPPDNMVRGAILLRAAVPGIARRAETLRHALTTLARNRDEKVERRRRLEFANAALREKRVHIDTLIEEKRILRHTTVAAVQEASRRDRDLGRQAKDLRDLMARLERARAERRQRQIEDRRKAAAAPRLLAPQRPDRPFSRARGSLRLPAVGRVVGTYGQATSTGMTQKGITIETRAGAQVVAPYDGEVVFAGQFRGYGQLLIIEHGEGYHSLLAGLARLEGALGSRLLAGEPVGVMGRKNSRNPSLYMELRRNGQPINPLPWLAARKG